MGNKIRIGINALSAAEGGGLVYLQNLLKELDNTQNIDIVLFVTPRLSSRFTKLDIQKSICHHAGNRGLSRALWESTFLPRKIIEQRIDIIFCPGGSINFHLKPNLLSVVTFQNMLVFDDIEKRNPYLRWDRKARLKLLEQRFKSSFRRTDLLIYLSKYAKRTVESFLPDACRNSIVVPHGLDDIFRTYKRTNIPRLHYIPEGEYIPYVSTVCSYKAQLEVVDAFAQLTKERETNERLLLVGPIQDHYGKHVRKRIAEHGLDGRVILTGIIPHRDIPSLYCHSKLIVFASKCENCPNVLLESMGSGKMVLCTDKEPMPEFAGDSVVYFNPYVPSSLSELFLHCIDNDELKRDMGQRAYQKSMEYSWARASKSTFSAIVDLAKRGR